MDRDFLLPFKSGAMTTCETVNFDKYYLELQEIVLRDTLIYICLDVMEKGKIGALIPKDGVRSATYLCQCSANSKDWESLFKWIKDIARFI